MKVSKSCSMSYNRIWLHNEEQRYANFTEEQLGNKDFDKYARMMLSDICLMELEGIFCEVLKQRCLEHLLYSDLYVGDRERAIEMINKRRENER